MRLAGLALTACSMLACTEAGDSTPPTDGCAFSPETDASFPAKLRGQLDGVIDDGASKTAAPGMAAVVVLGDGRVWHGSNGLSDVERGQAMDTSARFRIGSVTKTLTAAVLLQLVEEGTLSLSDTFDEWVAGWDLGPEVTIERLLNHTSGIGNYVEDGGFLANIDQPATPEHVVQVGLDMMRLHAPGEGFTYSNTNYFLLAWVLEAHFGQPYAQVIRERMLEGNDLEDMFLEGYEPASCEPIRGHFAGSPTLIDTVDMSWVWAAGGYVATLSEQCEWVKALVATGEVLEEGARQQMQSPSAFSVDAGHPYGIGMEMVERNGRYVYGHVGNTVGFHGSVFVDRDAGTCVAVGTNDFIGDFKPIDRAIWELLDTPSGS